ncbi:MAG: tRNA (adenosine(37)-N6)-dimethylallyltransferase MiaA [Bacteroidetes bacterium]|nr:tRNA (adenosine(37)-N6)-dimethylallyltransferase MiaA [Bacteroidota bacterium]
MNEKHLIVIAGPTAVGKTAIAIRLAQHFNTDIISADARQFYKEMNIGTAKPTDEQLKLIPHHFINFLSVNDVYNVGQYEKDVLEKLNELFKTHDVVIMTGGAGLFIRAVTEGLDVLPSADPEIRESLQELFETQGIEALQIKLEDVDPEYYKKVDIQNPVRLIRALEVFYATGKPISTFHIRETPERPFKSIKICLEIERETLYNIINNRVDKMIDNGLLKEAENLFPLRHLNALQTVGYSELFDYLENTTDLKTAIEKIKQNTRNYAKRQMTWFRKDKEFVWINADDYEKIQSLVEAQLIN